MDFIIVVLICFAVIFVGIIVLGVRQSIKEESKKREIEKRKKADLLKSQNEKVQRANELKLLRIEKLVYFRNHVFPIKAENEDVQKEWSHWLTKIHDTDGQLRQQIKSLYEVIPICVDLPTKTGVFSDIMATGEIYETSLKSCTCKYFGGQSHPCAHMYRLFSILSGTDPNCDHILSIDAASVKKFNSLGHDRKINFLRQIQNINPAGRDIFLSPELQEQINAGLFSKSVPADFSPVLNDLTKDELILALKIAGIKDARPSWSKVKLIAWVSENHQAFLQKRFDKYVHISASPEIISWGKTLSMLKNNCTFSHPDNWESLCTEVDA